MPRFLRAVHRLPWLVLLALGCSPTADEGASNPELGPIRVVVHPYLSFAPVLLAAEAGYFEDVGLDVEIVELASSANYTPALIQGELDILPEPISPGTLNAMVRGARLKMVAGKGFWDEGSCAVTHVLAHGGLFDEGDPVAGLRAEQGQRFSIANSLSGQYLVDRALGSVGLDLEWFERVNIPAASEHQGFRNGSLALSITSEPWRTRIVDDGHAKTWVTGAEILPNLQFSYFVFGPGMLDDRPVEDGARFLEAYLRAVRELEKGKTSSNVELLARATKLEPELLERACWTRFRDDGALDEESFRGFQEWLLERDLLDRMVEPDEYWDDRFRMRALERLDRDHKGVSDG